METLRDEIVQNKGILREITQQVYGSSELVDVRPFQSGMLNLNIALRIRNPDTTFNLRIFSGQDAEARAKRENTAYATISGSSGSMRIPVPEIYIVDYSKSIIDSVFSLQSLVPGVNLDDSFHALAGGEQEDVARQIGRVLGQLHQIEIANFGDLTADEKSTAEETWRDYILGFVNSNLLQALEVGSISRGLFNRVLQHFNRWDWIVPRGMSPSLVHRDMHLGNIMVQQDSRRNFNLSGVLDFEHAFGGHSEYEFAMLYLEVFKRYPLLKQPVLQGYFEVNALSDLFDLRVSKVYQAAKITEFLGFCARYQLPNEESAQHIIDMEGVID